ncbi:hypothetical protein BTW07_18720 [Salinicola socius]|uniref:Uncharacterized protein n=1 Tax=Salinicola socius TaxID=404433 RepID=A0A1Q8SME3_9GAMM|nr:hypothetical protein BTW07_18720 [Salinicola socius]
MMSPLVGSIAGAIGSTVSTLRVKLGLAGETLPAASVAVAVKSTSPSGRAFASPMVNDQLPSSSASAVPIWVPLARIATVALASAVPVSVGVASLVLSPSPRVPVGSMSSVALSITGATGSVTSMVTAPRLPTPLVLPAASV